MSCYKKCKCCCKTPSSCSCTGAESWSHAIGAATINSVTPTAVAASVFTFTAECPGTYEVVVHGVATAAAAEQLVLQNQIDATPLVPAGASSVAAAAEAISHGNLVVLLAGVHTYTLLISNVGATGNASIAGAYATIRCIKTPA